MTLEDLTKLDNYSRKPLNQLTEIQLSEYRVLLEMRLKEVAEQIWMFINK